MLDFRPKRQGRGLFVLFRGEELVSREIRNYSRLPIIRTSRQIETRRCGSVYLGVVVLPVRYFEHALLQLKNCHHILPERTNPLLHLFAEPHSVYSMSQSTTKIIVSLT